MAVKIRLKRMGSKKKPFYRIVAADSRNARDGRFIETLGYYNPMKDPPDVNLNEDSLYKWIERGALPTPNTESILRKVGFMQKWQLFKQGVKREDIDRQVGERAPVTKTPLPAAPAKSAKKEKPETPGEPEEPAAEPADTPDAEDSGKGE